MTSTGTFYCFLKYLRNLFIKLHINLRTKLHTNNVPSVYTFNCLTVKQNSSWYSVTVICLDSKYLISIWKQFSVMYAAHTAWLCFIDVSLVKIHYDANDKQRCGRKPSWLLIEFYRTDRRITWKSVIRTVAALRWWSFLTGVVPADEAVSGTYASL